MLPRKLNLPNASFREENPGVPLQWRWEMCGMALIAHAMQIAVMQTMFRFPGHLPRICTRTLSLVVTHELFYNITYVLNNTPKVARCICKNVLFVP